MMSGTDSRKELVCEGPVIILVEPQLGENIGMVARAMANFGLWDLRGTGRGLCLERGGPQVLLLRFSVLRHRGSLPVL